MIFLRYKKKGVFFVDVSIFDNYDKVRIHNIIKALRKEKKITQKELAKKLNITQSAVSQFESGQTNLTEQQLESVLVVLGVSLSDFFMLYHDILSRHTHNEVIQKAIEENKKECEALPGKIIAETYKLNEHGQKKVFNYISDLLQIDKYKK